jgi:hypothetical protein
MVLKVVLACFYLAKLSFKVFRPYIQSINLTRLQAILQTIDSQITIEINLRKRILSEQEDLLMRDSSIFNATQLGKMKTKTLTGSGTGTTMNRQPSAS